MSKTLEARIKHKKDTLANWTTRNPVLLDGEIILVEMENGTVRQKCGNGTSSFSALPYSDVIADLDDDGVLYWSVAYA